MKTPIVDIQNLCFSYDKDETLCSISLSIEKGDFLGLIGPNGSGKSTLLKVILGLLKAQEGSVKLFGTEISNFKQWTRIGYIPQKANYIETSIPISVNEIVQLGRVAKVGLGSFLGQSDKEAIDQALESVGMLKYKNRQLTELSGGEQQRVFIAKALASSPELLILDEPTIGVDVSVQDEFYQLLSELNKKGITLIIVSHDIDVIVNEVNKLACLNKKLVYHGTPKDFIKEDYLEKLYGKTRKFILHDH